MVVGIQHCINALGLSEINEEAFVGLNAILLTTQWGDLGLVNWQMEGTKTKPNSHAVDLGNLS